MASRVVDISLAGDISRVDNTSRVGNISRVDSTSRVGNFSRVVEGIGDIEVVALACVAKKVQMARRIIILET